MFILIKTNIQSMNKIYIFKLKNTYIHNTHVQFMNKYYKTLQHKKMNS